jgi:PhzF family phenazine biosynthesis protein
MILAAILLAAMETHMPFPLWHVDAFTDRLMAGNPAAVCLVNTPQPDDWLQRVAAEMNLSETAFLWREDEAFRLRWFTPKMEVALCGHATLASAHVLWSAGYARQDSPLAFDTLSGRLSAIRQGTSIELDFPLKPEHAADTPDGLADALGAMPVYVGRSEFDYLVEMDSPGSLRSLQPDFRALAALPVRGIIVTSRSDDSRYDFLSRFFAPGAGVDEDPVTGSAHCCLADFWGHRLDKDEMVAYQASARGGFVRVRVAGDRVKLGGQAVTVAKGELLV